MSQSSDRNDNARPAYEPPDADRPATASPTEGLLEADLERHDPYAALRVPAYRRYALGWMTAVIGQTMTATALGWQIYQLTDSKLALGIVAGIQVIPLILLALPAGVVADRLDRRRIIALTSVLAAACSLGLAILPDHPDSVPIIYALVFLSATVLTLGRPARSALLPQLVPTRILSNAITWNSSNFQIAAMSGPALAGLIIN